MGGTEIARSAMSADNLADMPKNGLSAPPRNTRFPEGDTFSSPGLSALADYPGNQSPMIRAFPERDRQTPTAFVLPLQGKAKHVQSPSSFHGSSGCSGCDGCSQSPSPGQETEKGETAEQAQNSSIVNSRCYGPRLQGSLAADNVNLTTINTTEGSSMKLFMSFLWISSKFLIMEDTMKTTRKTTWQFVFFLCITISGVVSLPAAGLADSFSWTTIDVPGATLTWPLGINLAGEIVGEYFDSNGVVHGFLLSHGRFTTIDVPGASGSEACGIKPAGEIVGGYLDSNWVGHGFLLSHGRFTRIDVPGASGSVAYGINPAGEISGQYTNSNGVSHGFLLSHGRYFTIDPPGSTSTSADGINPAREIVGFYVDGAALYHGFLFSKGNYISIDVPGASGSAAFGINPAGEIVGEYDDYSGVGHGFLLSEGTFTTIDFPNANVVYTNPDGISPQGDIVGAYVVYLPDSGSYVYHGFLLKRERHWRQWGNNDAEEGYHR